MAKLSFPAPNRTEAERLARNWEAAHPDAMIAHRLPLQVYDIKGELSGVVLVCTIRGRSAEPVKLKEA